MDLADHVIGDRSRLPLPLILSLRSLLLRRRAESLLCLFALSASVALAASVEMSTRSVNSALQESADSLAGSAQLEVSAGETPISEDLVELVRAVDGVRSASPVIQHTFRVSGGIHEGEAVRIVAIDLLYDGEVRDYRLEKGGFAVRDPLRLMASSDALVVATRLADRLGLDEGSRLHLRSAKGEHTFVVRGFLSGSLSEAFAGQIAVADLYGLQEVLGFGPVIDRIDIAVSDGVDLDTAISRIQAHLGGSASVRRSSLREEYVDSIMSSLNLTVWTVAFIGVLLSLFLTYAIVSLSVDRRIEELSLLRAAGMQGRTVTRLIVTDIVVLATLGTLLGSLAAVYLSDVLMSVFSRTSSYLQQLELHAVEVHGSTLLVAIVVGVPVAILASIEPALRAGRRPPLDVLRGNKNRFRARAVNRRLCAVGIAALAMTLVAWLSPIPTPPALRLAIAILAGVLAIVSGLGQALLLAFPRVQHLLGWLSPRIGYLACTGLRERPVETGATIAVWGAVTGALIALMSMIHSIATSIDDYWIGLNGSDVTMVFAQDPLSSRDRELIRNSTIDALRSAPGVLDVAPYYNIVTLVRGEQVELESLATRALVEHSGGARSISDDPEETIGALLRGELVMTRSFARHFGVSVGDSLTLSTSRGSHEFRVGAFVRAYAGSNGLLSLDLDTYNRWFPQLGAPQVALWTREAGEQGLAEVRRDVRSQALFFRHGEAFRRHTKEVLAKFEDILTVPVFLIAAIGVIALMNLLLGNILAKKLEFAVLRASGATSGDLVTVVLLSGVLIGLLGTACGMALAYPWTDVITEAVAESMGYDIRTTFDLPAAGTVAFSSLFLALLSGLIPALRSGTPIPTGASALS